MPFTPFHFGAHTLVALSFKKQVDIPAFILANVVIDVEPLLVMLFNFDYPLHGYAHTLLGASIIGLLWGIVAYMFRAPLGKMMNFLGLPASSSLIMSLLSGLLGGCLHVLFDAPIYTDIRPFYPLNINPLYGIISISQIYLLCKILFIPAIVVYFLVRKK
ncbi:MAG: hydrolase [Candidatus Omnitrophica bacterium]|nr:hydrolase [Candidatus Omnitrophota bacterium]